MSVSITSIGAMLFTLLISFVLPIVLIIVVKRKTGAPVLNAFVGAGIFILFVLILEQILHWLVLSYTPVAQIPAAYILYGCLAAGVFEETGRFFAFTVLKRKEPDTKLGNALMYGVGHGGAEAILLVAGSTASTLFLALLLNVGGVEGLTAGMTGETLATAMEDLTRLTTTSSLLYMMPGLERLVALCLHIALSVLVWMTVTGRLSKIDRKSVV